METPRYRKTRMSKLDEHRALVTAFYHTFSLADVTQFDVLLASDWINHPTDPGRKNNREGFKGGLQDFHAAFENFHIHIDAIVAENDLIVCRITMSGRHIGTLGHLQPSGNDIVFSGMDMHRITGGKIAETWHFERFPTPLSV